MEDIGYNGNLDFKIHSIGFVSVLRNEGYLNDNTAVKIIAFDIP